MLYKKMGIIIISSFVVVLLGIFFYNKLAKVDYIPTAYETELIDYFKEVALQSEFDEDINRVIKWKQPMLLCVVKDKTYKRQMDAIQKTIDGINELATDGFKIELTNEPKKSNSFIYLCSREYVAKLAPNFYKSFTDDIDVDVSGFAYMEFNWNNYKINKSFIYIDPEDPIDIQESTILEEITQGVGLPNDPESYSNSIFYEHKSEENIVIKEYSQLDKDVIKLLYHPKMKPGLDSTQCEKVIKRILKKGL